MIALDYSQIVQYTKVLPHTFLSLPRRHLTLTVLLDRMCPLRHGDHSSQDLLVTTIPPHLQSRSHAKDVHISPRYCESMGTRVFIRRLVPLLPRPRLLGSYCPRALLRLRTGKRGRLRQYVQSPFGFEHGFGHRDLPNAPGIIRQAKSKG
jgi:hypothetical protein